MTFTSPNKRRNEAIVASWASGLSVADIALKFGVSKNVVLGVVWRAREAGDPRAVMRDERRAVRRQGYVPLSKEEADSRVRLIRRRYYSRHRDEISEARRIVRTERLKRLYAYADGSAWA